MMEAVVVEVVASMVIVGEFELWFDVVGSFMNALRWCMSCCNVGVRVQRRSEVVCRWRMARGLNGILAAYANELSWCYGLHKGKVVCEVIYNKQLVHF